MMRFSICWMYSETQMTLYAVGAIVRTIVRCQDVLNVTFRIMG